MTFIKKLKRSKDMSDDELFAEFKTIQGIVRKRGEHVPLPVKHRDDLPDGRTPPIHRPSAEKQLEALRADLEKDPDLRDIFEKSLPAGSFKGREKDQKVAQNTFTDAAKGISKARRVHSLGDKVKTGLDLQKLLKDKDFEEFKQMGQIKVPRDKFIDQYGSVPGALDAYEEGRREANMTPGERAKWLADKEKQKQKKKK